MTRADAEDDIAVLARSEAMQLRRVSERLAANGSAAPTIADTDAGVLIALGPGRYVNRMFATRDHLSNDDIEELVAFFETCGVAPSVQIANPTEPTIRDLTDAGFELDWERALCTTRPRPGAQASTFDFLRVDESSLDTWLDVLARGNEITQADSRAISDDFARAAHSANDSAEWLALSGDTPVGCGSLAHRLDRAAAQGFGIVAATAVAASGSARNLVRCGFAVVAVQGVYTRH